jgi:translation initiation factor IF-2
MPKKIFELAKELGKGALDLVEDLKAQGFNVRNHMSVLSDEDVDVVLAKVKEEEDKAKATKKTVRKKKVAKKKAASSTEKKATKKATKKTTKKVASSSDTETAKKGKSLEASEDGTTTKKKAVVRKKVVRRKKDAETPAVKDEETSSSSEEVIQASVSEEVTTPAVASSSEAGTEESPQTGIRIVSRPEVSQPEPAKESAAPADAQDTKEYYKEKVHKFTPVYIPPKEEIEAKAAAKAAAAKEAGEANKTPAAPGAEKEEAGKTEDKASKKRLGSLASMMSGKKGVVSKSQVLNQSRSENELKSYGALNSIGRPLYTNLKRKKIYSGSCSQTEITQKKDSKRVIQLHKGATVEDIAYKLGVKSKNLIDKCLDLNLLLKPEDFVGIILAEKMADLYNFSVLNKAFDEEAVLGSGALSEEEKSKFPSRNPIIAIMGHVDHGKTTLLDYVRKEKVASGEAGGITQHIGAYSVEVSNKTLTFLDTPGHAAFAAMRERGAQVTDVVILVVAADDGVMPQTKESVEFCQNNNVPVIVAVNKMDKEGVNPDRVKQELTEVGITPEDWGGDTQCVGISALKGDGVDELLEAVALQAEMMELRADPAGKGQGIVIEARVEQGRGPMATVLIQSGSLKKGENIVVGETFGRARSLMDSNGAMLKTAGPSTPVQILGLNKVPSPGDSLNVVKNEREAKKVVENREREKLELQKVVKVEKKVSLEDFFGQENEDGEEKILNLIIRTDVQGSFEAIRNAVEVLGNSEVGVKVIAGGAGAVVDSDVSLAESSGAIIMGFNMRPVATARRLAEQKGIEVKTYSIIYELINDVKLSLEGLLEPEFVEEFIGRAEVKDTFNIPKIGTIAGTVVIDGKIQVGCNIRLLRDGKIMHDGKLSSLRRFKDNVKEVKSGLECGMALENYTDVVVGDQFEAYILNQRKRTLDDDDTPKRGESPRPEANL